MKDTRRDGFGSDVASGARGAPARPGQSGEGAGSALQQLIQLERRRNAQLPREDAAAGPPAVPRREQVP